jgi:predicted type IV restriction endonuclease
MPPIPRKIVDRLTNGIKRFQAILTAAKTRDVNESDTSMIVTDMLSEIFGYDKYSEITSEFAIRGTSCDLALRVDGRVHCLVELKAVGMELKDAHVKQAVDYAANEGIDWAILTNGVSWRIYKVCFSKPIDQELVAECDILALNPKDDAHIDLLYLVTKEGGQKSVLDDFHTQKQALSRFFIGAMVLSESVLNVIRRELKRVSPDVKIEIDQIRNVLAQEVLKREVQEGDKAEEARKKIARVASRAARKANGAVAAQATAEQPQTSPHPAASAPPVSAAVVAGLAEAPKGDQPRA